MDWPNFLEKIVDILGLVLTDAETEKFLKTFSKNSTYVTIMKTYSSENMAKLAREAEKSYRICKHPGDCTTNCLRGATRAFIAAYVVKYFVAILPAIITRKIFQKPQLLLEYAGKDTIRFALFLSLFVSGFKGINCAMRKYRQKEDKLNAFVAGSVAGLSLLLDEKSRRTSIALYISTRALEFVYVYLMRRGMLPNIPHGDALVMAISSSQILYALLREQDTLSKSYYSFLLTHGGFSKYGDLAKPYLLSLSNTTYDRPTDLTPLKHLLTDYPLPFEELNNSPNIIKTHALSHPHTDSCTMGSVHFLMEAMPRSLKLYVPLNVLMGLLFRYKLLLKRPDQFLLKTALSSLRSSIFLSLYCANGYFTPCHFRNLLKKDYNFVYYLNGFISGLAVLIEQKPRRLELAMYCLPRALESFWNSLIKWGYVKNIKNGEVIYYSIAMGALMSIYQNEPDNLNSAYRAVMTRIFGVN